MAEHLLPPHDLSLPATRPRASADGEGEDGEGNSKRGYEQMFRDQIALVDEAGVSFRVQYEGVSCNAQKHLRLTCGWRDYIRKHDVELGESTNSSSTRLMPVVVSNRLQGMCLGGWPRILALVQQHCRCVHWRMVMQLGWKSAGKPGCQPCCAYLTIPRSASV